MLSVCASITFHWFEVFKSYIDTHGDNQRAACSGLHVHRACKPVLLDTLENCRDHWISWADLFVLSIGHDVWHSDTEACYPTRLWRHKAILFTLCIAFSSPHALLWSWLVSCTASHRRDPTPWIGREAGVASGSCQQSLARHNAQPERECHLERRQSLRAM